MLNSPKEIADQKFSDVGILTLRNDGIITFEPKEGKIEHELEAMKVELEIFKEWASGKKLGFISDNRTLKKFDAEVRIYAQQQLPFFCNKFALIISSGISSFLTNIFIHMNRPKVPVKAFTNKEDAVKWLKS
jgi:hypothetical protein